MITLAYNPAQIPPEQLLREFTARRDLLTRLIDLIADNETKSVPQHALLTGIRGHGKSTTLQAVRHLLCRPDLAHLLTNEFPSASRFDPKRFPVSARWLPITFAEDPYHIIDWKGFFREILKRTEIALSLQNSPNQSLQTPITDEFRKREAEKGDTPDTGAWAALKAYSDLLKQYDRRAILLIDNLNETYPNLEADKPTDSKKFNVGNFLEWLDTTHDTMIVATAVVYGGATVQRERNGKTPVKRVDDLPQDLRQKFAIEENLSAFNHDEVRNALNQLAGLTAGGGSTDETLLTESQAKQFLNLTGGTPRLIKLIGGLLQESFDSELKDQLTKLLDSYTPFIKDRVERLAPEQRRIYHAVADLWDPASAAEIAVRAGMGESVNLVSGHLKNLLTTRLIVSEGPNKRNIRYRLADRFGNIYHLMRNSPAGTEGLDWMLRFYEIIWETPYGKRTRERVVAEAQLGDARANMLLQEMERRLQAETKIPTGRVGQSGVSPPLTLEELFQSSADDSKINHALSYWLIQGPFEAIPRTGANSSYGIWGSIRDQIFSHPAFTGQRCETAIRSALNPRGTIDELAFKAFVQLRLGQLFDHHKRWDDAENALIEACKTDQGYAYPWNARGILLAKQDRTAEAERCYRKAVQLDEAFSLPWNNLGNLFYVNNRIAEAEAAYRRAISLDPENAYPHNGLGNTLRDRGMVAEAEDAYKEAIRLDCKFSLPYNNLGNLYSEQNNRTKEALDAYDQAILLDGKNPHPHNGRGNILRMEGLYDEARVSYQKAIELDEFHNDGKRTFAYPWSGLGRVFKEMGRPDEAERAYRTAIEVDPKFGYARSALAMLLQSTNPGNRVDEGAGIRKLAAEGWALNPHLNYTRYVFQELCKEDIDCWRHALSPAIRHLVKPEKYPALEGYARTWHLDLVADGLLFLYGSGNELEAREIVQNAGAQDALRNVLDAMSLKRGSLLKEQVAPERLSVVEVLAGRIRQFKLPFNNSFDFTTIAEKKFKTMKANDSEGHDHNDAGTAARFGAAMLKYTPPAHIKTGGRYHNLSGAELNFPNKLVVERFTEKLVQMFFPGFFGEPLQDAGALLAYVDKTFEDVRKEFGPEIRKAIKSQDRISDRQRDARVGDIISVFLDSFERIHAITCADIEAAFLGDPAAASIQEVILAYPYVPVVIAYRLAHELYKQNVPFIPRIMTEWGHRRSGLDIHPGAVIGKGFFCDHATMTTIGQTCVIEDKVRLYQGVGLVAKSLKAEYDEESRNEEKKRHPTIGEGTTIYANAIVIGDIRVGRNCIIGGNAIVIEDVPDNSIVKPPLPETQVFKRRSDVTDPHGHDGSGPRSGSGNQ